MSRLRPKISVSCVSVAVGMSELLPVTSAVDDVHRHSRHQQKNLAYWRIFHWMKTMRPVCYEHDFDHNYIPETTSIRFASGAAPSFDGSAKSNSSITARDGNLLPTTGSTNEVLLK